MRRCESRRPTRRFSNQSSRGDAAEFLPFASGAHEIEHSQEELAADGVGESVGAAGDAPGEGEALQDGVGECVALGEVAAPVEADGARPLQIEAAETHGECET